MSFPLKTGHWRQEGGSQQDVAVSTRVRLARSLPRLPYPHRLTPDQGDRLWEGVGTALNRLDLHGPWTAFALPELTGLQRRLLVERRYLDAASPHCRGLFAGPGEKLVVSVGEEDHLRLQSWSAGLELDRTWRAADLLDSALDGPLAFAADPRRGYLNSTFKQSGNGLKASVLLHLPGADQSGILDKVFMTAESQGLSLRGLWADDQSSLGHLFQLSSPTAGLRSETEVLDNLVTLADQVITLERKAREIFALRQSVELKDRVGRAQGILRYAATLGYEEAVRLLSDLRFGVSAGIISDIGLPILDACLYLVQRGHMEWFSGKEGRATDEFRAAFVKKAVFESSGGEHV